MPPSKIVLFGQNQGWELGNFIGFSTNSVFLVCGGGYKLNRHDISDLWNIKREVTSDYKHPTQKPLEIMTKILQDTPENAIILDPFGGSCTTAVACKQLKRNYICIEKEAKYVAICHERLKQEHLF